jgi:hypothetical protein
VVLRSALQVNSDTDENGNYAEYKRRILLKGGKRGFSHDKPENARENTDQTSNQRVGGYATKIKDQRSHRPLTEPCADTRDVTREIWKARRGAID